MIVRGIAQSRKYNYNKTISCKFLDRLKSKYSMGNDKRISFTLRYVFSQVMLTDLEVPTVQKNSLTTSVIEIVYE